MKFLFTLLLSIQCLSLIGQTNKFKPFKLIVLKPDTAIIDESFNSEIDSVQSDFQKSYYYSIKTIEEFVNSKHFENDPSFKTSQESSKIELIAAKALESEIKKFKYYQTISSGSTKIYNFYFNEYEPYSTIVELPSQKTDVESLNKLASNLKADYVVFFSNIHTEIKAGLQIMNLTTHLYSKKENNIIMTKQTEGDANSRGDMWTCGSITLSCLLINSVRTSTDEIAPEISRLQMKK